MRDQGRIKGPSSDPIEYLRAQNREMRQQIDDLYRRIGGTSSVTSRTAAGEAEGFCIGFDETRSAGANSVDFYTFTDGWMSSGVSIKYSSFTMSNSLISIPAGIWTIGALFYLQPAANPTTGEVRLTISNDGSPGGYVACRDEISLSDLQDNFTAGQSDNTMATVNYIAAPDDIYLIFGNGTDVSIEVIGEIFGVQHAGKQVTIY